MHLSDAIQSDVQSARSQSYRDYLGIAASVACAIHCAAMPFVIGFLPLLGLSFLADPSFHKWMVGVCLLFALLAFVPGWRRHHRLGPGIVGVVGLFLISLAAFAGPEDCCPTPCEASTGSPNMSAAVPIVMLEEENCTASCCPPSGQPAVSATLVSVPASNASPAECGASCCPVDGQESASGMQVASAVPPAESADCEMACCPTEPVIEEPATAGMVDWMWILMTPLGGLVLVAAHLYNHKWSCSCAAGCCDGVSKS